ncbi:hypothetical protein HY212_05575 [Candidatus Pacearchaeota archaeon]|nr:hypothetical protein [Candidatus Pacearchaeota archaeon]
MGLDKVVHTKNFDFNKNPSRVIVGMLPPPVNSSINIEQVRVALITEEGDNGNHWREYKERYGIIGNAEFILKDIDSGEQRKYEMATGDTLDIPPRIALRIRANIGSVIICVSESYDRDKGTHKYNEFEG